MSKFNNDFVYFWDLINSGVNFAFARYADGEVMLMKGQEVGAWTQASSVDNWQAPNKLTKVGKELIQTLDHTEDNYYYAISSTSDNINDYLFLKSNIKQNNNELTFVNLWINGNYKKMIQNLISNKREVVLICNEKAKKENFPFNVVSIKKFPNDCINFWENNSEEYITELLNDYKDYSNMLFYVSCGPVSEIIIDRLYKNNPNNTYIDVGSSIDEFVHNETTRPYMIDGTIYSTMISNF